MRVMHINMVSPSSLDSFVIKTICGLSRKQSSDNNSPWWSHHILTYLGESNSPRDVGADRYCKSCENNGKLQLHVLAHIELE